MIIPDPLFTIDTESWFDKDGVTERFKVCLRFAGRGVCLRTYHDNEEFYYMHDYVDNQEEAESKFKAYIAGKFAELLND